MGFLRKLLIDESGHASQRDSYERTVQRMRGPKVTPGRSTKASEAPKACGQRCGPYDRKTRQSAPCTGTIRGGQCSCRYC